MERLLTVKDIQQRYQVNPATARKYIRQMVHMESPLMVAESAVEAWERKKTIAPDWMIRERLRRAR